MRVLIRLTAPPADLLHGQGKIITLPTLLFSKISGGTLDASAAGITLVVTVPGIILLLITERFIKEEAFGKGFGN